LPSTRRIIQTVDRLGCAGAERVLQRVQRGAVQDEERCGRPR
jgi:hypothetical protein